jgi:FeS assembly SUF system protein
MSEHTATYPAQARRFDVEIVDAVEPPPKQPPLAGDVPRKRDYLDGFLKAQPEGAAEELEGDTLKEAVIAALRDIFDPEIPVNIYDLGLIYGVDIDEGHAVITMTLTTPHCPVAETMPGEVELRVMSVPGIATAEVNLVWDPAWNPASMTDEARLELGML